MPSPSTRWRRFSNSAFALRGPTSSTRRSYSGPTRFRSAALHIIRMLTTAAATATMTRMTTIKIMVPADTVTSVTSACRPRLPDARAAKPRRGRRDARPAGIPAYDHERKARWDVGDGDGARGARGARFAWLAGNALHGSFGRRVGRRGARGQRNRRARRRPDLGRVRPPG